MQNDTRFSRRFAIKAGLASSLGLLASLRSSLAMAGTTPVGAKPLFESLGRDPLFSSLTYPYALPDLPHAMDAFEPMVDAKTMEIHHGRHHAGYVRKLNAALESAPEWQSVPLDQLLARLDELPSAIRESVRNNGGGHLNHTIYWATMTPGGTAPEGALAAAVKRDFGDLSALEDALVASGGSRFGSGWAWLTSDAKGRLAVSSTANQDNPVMEGVQPLFGIDVWEHAYYLNYQNRRGDYLKAFLGLAGWGSVSKRYEALVAVDG
jgi:Fe-Mn family superoxide dismutase